MEIDEVVSHFSNMDDEELSEFITDARYQFTDGKIDSTSKLALFLLSVDIICQKFIPINLNNNSKIILDVINLEGAKRFRDNVEKGVFIPIGYKGI